MKTRRGSTTTTTTEAHTTRHSDTEDDDDNDGQAHAPPAHDGLTEYERMRLENIRRNQEAMREFQLPEATAAVATPRDRKKRSAPTPGVQREKRVKNTENLPRRTSNRLAKIEPDGPQAKEKHEKFTETFQSLDRLKQTRRAGDLSLSDASSGHGDVARFGKLLQEMATYVPENARVIDPEDMSDPEDEPSSVKEESKDHTITKGPKETTETKETKETKDDNGKTVKKEEDGDEDKKTGIRKYFSRATRASADTTKSSHPTATTTPSKTKSSKDPSLRKKVQDLQIKGPWPTVKVCQGRIYCMAIHENKDKILVCGGDIDGNLGFWDLDETLDENHEPDYDEEPNIYSYKAHTRTLSSMQYSPTDPTKLFTSSYDGSIRYLDLGKQQFIESYVVSPDASDHLGSVSLTSSGQQLWFADDEGGVTLKDVRTPKDEMVFRKLLHDKKVGCVNVNPKYDHLIVTSSLDRTMKIWDIRTFGKHNKDDEPIQHLAEFPHGLSVTSAMWSPDGASIASTSYDDNVRIFNNFKPSLPDLTEIPDPVRIRHNNNSGRWVTMLRAVWSFQFNWFSIGNMNKSVDIFSRGTGDLMANLRDPQNLTTVPAVNAWHPNRVLLASGMANGKMVIWR